MRHIKEEVIDYVRFFKILLHVIALMLDHLTSQPTKDINPQSLYARICFNNLKGIKIGKTYRWDKIVNVSYFFKIIVP